MTVSPPCVPAPPDDTHQVHHRLDGVEGAAQGNRVTDATVLDRDLAMGKHSFAAGSVDQHPHLMIALQQFPDHSPTEESGTPGYQNNQDLYSRSHKPVISKDRWLNRNGGKFLQSMSREFLPES